MKNLFKKERFTIETCGRKYAEFPYEYIEKIMLKSKGYLNVYLKSYFENCGYIKGTHNIVYMDIQTAKIVMKEIKYYKKNKKWRPYEKR